MAALLAEFPTFHATINLAPSLLEQIEDYVNGTAVDPWLAVGRKPTDDLTLEDRRFLLRNFFHAHPDTMIQPHPRYAALWEKRGNDFSDAGVDRAAAGYSVEDLRDLQVWFHLVWTDPRWIRDNEALRALQEKGSSFTEGDKRTLFEVQAQIVARVIPIHRDVTRSGQVELSTSPYFHPILPLLCDSESAREAMPDRPPLTRRFRAPEDARAQLHLAREYMSKLFGSLPVGLWPSEGSVSDAAAAVACEEGFRWMASDEEVLAASLNTAFPRDSSGAVVWPEILYRPYAIETPSGRIHCVFRDHVLSDLVGFVYHRWRAEDAAEDFVRRLASIHAAQSSWDHPTLVSVILDGENAWEHYPGDGEPFLRALYGRIAQTDWVRPVAIGEFLREHSEWPALPHLFAGSWIGHNFAVWIGHAEDRRAWDELGAAREHLIQHAASYPEFRESEAGRQAFRCLYAAEGSDWTWWYGEEHSTPQKAEFDRLFRRNLLRIYDLLGMDPTESLLRPIFETADEGHRVSYGLPVLDGSRDGGGWPATPIVHGGGGGAMHRTANRLESVLICADRTRLYVKLLPAQGVSFSGYRLEIRVVAPRAARVNVDVSPESSHPVLEWWSRAGDATAVWVASDTTRAEAVNGAALDVALPLAELGVRPGESVRLFFRIRKDDRIEERTPEDGLLDLWLPESL